jgi:hypothetical protein
MGDEPKDTCWQPHESAFINWIAGVSGRRLRNFLRAYALNPLSKIYQTHSCSVFDLKPPDDTHIN